MLTHKLKYGVYWWDTFDNETDLVGEFNHLHNAVDFVESKYRDRLSSQGADKIEIVDDNGTIVKDWRIG